MGIGYTSVVFGFFLGLIISFQVAGQNINGHIIDAASGNPVSGVSVMLKGTTKGTATDPQGNFSLFISGVPAVLVVSHLSYVLKEINIISLTPGKLDISLEPRSHQLADIEIKANPIVEIMKGHSLDILDYEFLEDDILILANRNGCMFSPCLVCVTPQGDTICTKDISQPVGLYKGYDDKVCFLSRSSAWQVTREEGTLDLDYIMDREEFLKTYPLVIDANEPFWILRQYKYQQQSLDYYVYKETDKHYNVFRSITNEQAIARSGWGPYFDNTEADEHFAKVIINRPVFAPMLRLGDSLVLFNYLDKRIEFYDNDGVKLGFVSASFMVQKGCREEIIKDDKRGKFYVRFLKNGISALYEIDLRTGSSSQSAIIPGFVFIEHISVHDGEVFFLYREKTDHEQKKIFRMKI